MYGIFTYTYHLFVKGLFSPNLRAGIPTGSLGLLDTPYQPGDESLQVLSKAF